MDLSGIRLRESISRRIATVRDSWNHFQVKASTRERQLVYYASTSISNIE